MARASVGLTRVRHPFRPGPWRLLGLAVLAACCAAVLYGRVYQEFDRVRIKVVTASQFSSGNSLVVSLPDLTRLSGAPTAVVLRLRNSSRETRTVGIAVGDSVLDRVAVPSRRTVRVDLSLPDHPGLGSDDRFELSGDGDGLALESLEIANIHGFSRGLFSFVITPAAAVSPDPVSPAAALLLFGLLLLGSLPLSRLVEGSPGGFGRFMPAAVALLVLAVVLVLPLVSRYKALLSAQTFWFSLALLYGSPVLVQTARPLLRLARTAIRESRMEPLPPPPVAILPPRTSSRRLLVGTFALLTGLTAVMTYPQFLYLGSGVSDVGDPLLNTWALSWVAHQLPNAPARLFDGNIFYPQRGTLAFSESLIMPALIVAPLSWVGVGPIFVYNVVFLSALVFSGLGVTLLVLELTGEARAAIVAGIIFAFLPFRMDHYPHLQLQQTQWIPLTMWALHRVMRSGRLADGAKLGMFAAFQMLSCVYFGVFLIPYAAVVALLLLAAEARIAKRGPGVVLRYDRGLKRRLLVFGVAAAVYLALVAPVGRAYVAASGVVGVRSIDEVASGSATARNYLAAPRTNVLYGRWADTFGTDERRLFPGAVAFALALVGVWRLRSAAQFAYGVALLLAFDLSLGFNGLSYRVLWNTMLPFQGLRVPARMGLFVGFSLAVLAGYGVTRLIAQIQSPSRRRLLAVGLSLFILLEYRSKPLNLAIVPNSPPPVYADLIRSLEGLPRTAIVELPIAREDPTYMYYSTFHWQNLLNGYSGFFPPSFNSLVLALESFPDAISLNALRQRGARYVIIHGELLRPEEYQALVSSVDRSADLKLVARRPWQDREISLYRLLSETP